ncbi:MAG TPA: HtaA domain-containing protein [Solirubrobacterales bacterium]|nr:HtaA domain-containing protein [Solirubrobacterales bacterium]
MRTRFAETRARAVVAAAAAALVACAAAAPAAAAPGQAVLELGPAAKTLQASGVRITPLGVAKGGARRIVLPVRTGLVGSTATVLRFGGGISLRRGKRAVQLSALRLTLGRRNGLAGKLGGTASGLFRVLAGGQRELDPARGSARLGGLRLRLSRSAAADLAGKLGLERRPSGVFATLSAADRDLPQSAPPSTGTEQQSTGCGLPSTAGGVPEDPLPVATRPPGAVDVTGASLRWDVRESFIRYISTGEGTSVFGGAGAASPEVRPGSSLPLTYSFGFPFAGGWLDPGADPADPADDRAAIYFDGGVRFLYSAHEIDLRTSAPEIELGGGASRAIFSVAEDAAPAQRQVIVNLDLGRAASVQRSSGTVTYDRVPGAIPAGTATSTFAGFYAPGTDFGCFSVSYSVAS